MSVEVRTGLTRELASFCAGIRGDALPPEVVDRAKYLLLDWAGVALRGSTVPSSRAMRRVVQRLGSPGPSTVVGTDLSLDPTFAALANGTSSHAIELDDVTSESSLHPAVAVFPAVLAVAEATGAPPEKLFEAVVVGYEVMMKLGNAQNAAAAYAQGFHPTGTCGVFGAAAGVGKLLGLDAEGLTMAMGIAGSMASGSMEYLSNGAWTKRMHPGWAAHGGIVAAVAAHEGYTGPDTIIEGPFGYLHAYTTDPRPHKVLENLGRPLEIMRTAIKVHACCRYMHAQLDGVLHLVREHDIRPEQVERVRVSVVTGGFNVVAAPAEQKQNVQNVVDAQFSMQCGAALAVVFRSTGLNEFSEEGIHDPRVREMMRRVECFTDPWVDERYPLQWRAIVSIALKDGREYSVRVDRPKGEPENPVTWEELIAKFRGLAEPVVGAERATAIVERVRDLDRAGDVRALAALLRA